MDISLNHFTTQGLLTFIQAVNKVKDKDVKLRSLSLAGNDLASANSAQQLVDALAGLFAKPFLQHLDLALTGITAQKQTAKGVMAALKRARALQSIHLSGFDVSQLGEWAREVFGGLLHKRTTLKGQPGGVDETWNEQYHLPHRRDVDIHADVCASLCGQPEKAKTLEQWQVRAGGPHASALGVHCGSVLASMQSQSQLTLHTSPSPHPGASRTDASRATEDRPDAPLVPEAEPGDTVGLQEQAFVLSRLMGRSDLKNNLSWTVKDEHEPGRTRDLRDLLDEQMKLEVFRGRQTVDSVCWVQSEECWVCDRWGYYLSIVTRADIEDGYGMTGASKLQPLTALQERAFSKVHAKASLSIEDLEQRVPYLVGGLTNGEFVKMSEFTEYMLSIDPEREKVRWNTQGDKNKAFSHYHDKWAGVLARAALSDPTAAQSLGRTHRTGTSAAPSKRAGEQAPPKQGALYPYKPHFDRKAGGAFTEYDTVWAYSTLLRPGTANYFLVYRFDADTALKA